MAEFQFQPSVRDERGIGLEAVVGRAALIDPSIIQTMHLDDVTADALTAIAWGFDMLGPLWEVLPDAASKRAFLKEVYTLQGRRGTPWAVITALDLLGWDANLSGNVCLYYNGVADFDGFWSYNTAPSGWYAWFLTIVLGAHGYSAADHALVKVIAEYYGRLSGRLERVTLDLGALSSSGGGAPDWSGTTELDRFGVSADGTTWSTRGFRSVTVGPGNTAAIDFAMFNIDANGTGILYLGLLRADGSVYAQQAHALIDKTDEIAIKGSWTITW